MKMATSVKVVVYSRRCRQRARFPSSFPKSNSRRGEDEEIDATRGYYMNAIAYSASAVARQTDEGVRILQHRPLARAREPECELCAVQINQRAV